MTVGNIIKAIEQAAPLASQEPWDNCGLLCGNTAWTCTGVMVCLDVSESVVRQAIDDGCNLIISHHPLIFKGIKVVTDTTLQGRALICAIKHSVAVYACHTSLDNAPWPWNVSHEMARMAGASPTEPLTAEGTGVIATLDSPVPREDFLQTIKETFGCKAVRCSRRQGPVQRIAFGSGSCGSLISAAIAHGVDAMVTSDVRYHDFLDYGEEILIADITHFDSEKCTKRLFKQIISQNISNFAPVLCAQEINPIEFL